MSLTLLKETTVDWAVRVPNHTYIFDGSTMYIVGYIKEGETKAIKFAKPMFFDKRRRTFTKVKPKSFDLSEFGV